MTAHAIAEIYRAEGALRLRPHLVRDLAASEMPLMKQVPHRPFMVQISEILPPQVLAELYRMVYE